MNGAEVFRRLGEEGPTWRDTLEALHERGVSDRQIAEQIGTDRGTIWRARTGQTRQPTTGTGATARNLRAAEAWRRRAAQGVRPGRVPVVDYNGRPAGWRTIPPPGRRPIIVEDPERIARYLELGRYDQAAAALSTQILDAYGLPGDLPHLGGDLEITDYPNGI